MEKSPAEQQEQPPRNLLTHYDETMAAIEQVEGAAWTRMQERGGNTTVSEAMKAIEYRTKLRAEIGTDDDEDRNPIAYTVYGIGGFNRWHVRLDGSVSFSRRNAWPESKVDEAEALGFSIE